MPDPALEIAQLRAALAASEAADAELAQARAVVSTSEVMIQHLRLEIARLRREQYVQSSERRPRLIGQIELQLEDIEAAADKDEIRGRRRQRRRPPTRRSRAVARPVSPSPSICPASGW